MTETEGRYAQVEKEALATIWACEKFATYFLGKKIIIETDHRPLVLLLGEKKLDRLPPRILRFRLRMSRFDYSIAHVPGKLLYTADALSRAPTSAPDDNSKSMQKEIEAIMEACISQLPASKMRLDIYSNAQRSDPDCQRVIDYCHKGWPDKKKLQASISPYWKMRSEFSMGGNLLLYRSRIVVPRSLDPFSKKHCKRFMQAIMNSEVSSSCSIFCLVAWSFISD